MFIILYQVLMLKLDWPGRKRPLIIQRRNWNSRGWLRFNTKNEQQKPNLGGDKDMQLVLDRYPMWCVTLFIYVIYICFMLEQWVCHKLYISIAWIISVNLHMKSFSTSKIVTLIYAWVSRNLL